MMSNTKRWSIVLFLGLTGGFVVTSPSLSHSMSSSSRDYANGSEPARKTLALVIGISHYQDPILPDMVLPHRDAELFAGFLQTQAAFSWDDRHLILLTNGDATSARVTASVDEIMDAAEKGDKVILFYSGYGVLPASRGTGISEPFFNDTPWSVRQSGSVDLFRLFRSQAASKNLTCVIMANLYPVILPGEQMDPDVVGKGLPERSVFEGSVCLNTVREETFKEGPGALTRARTSLVAPLLDGLLGLADRDGDLWVTKTELKKYLHQLSIPPQTSPGVLLILTESRRSRLAQVNAKFLSQLHKRQSQVLPSLAVGFATSSVESVLAIQTEEHRLLYQDFVVAIQLGHLLFPPHQNASVLYDSLTGIQSFEPLFGELRRTLAAAIQDETQQVLNAYLKADSRELARRRDDQFHYSLYPEYMERAIELLGPSHYMANLLLLKRYYFDGLNKRLEVEAANTRNEPALEEALRLQEQALKYEDEAPFVYNEIGLIKRRLGREDESRSAFEKAIELAPTWSIPYTNLSMIYLDKNPGLALRLSRHATRLSPQNPFAFNGMGLSLGASGKYAEAEGAFLQATQLDPKYADAWYNLGCLASLEAQFTEAYQYLDKAIQSGFSDIEHMRADPDLDVFRQQSLWNKLIVHYFPEQSTE